MSVNLMTQGGLIYVPQGPGGVNLELLTRIDALEQELFTIKQTIGSDLEYGLAKVTNSSSVNTENGIAMSAMQNNAAINGTLANAIAGLKNSVRQRPVVISSSNKTKEKLVVINVWGSAQNSGFLISARSHVAQANSVMYMLSFTTNTHTSFCEIVRDGGMAPNCIISGTDIKIDFYNNDGGAYSVIKLF